MEQNNLVIARRYGTPSEAELAAMELNAKGIATHIVSDDAGGAYPSLSQSNGVAVLVAEDRLAEARDILDAMDTSAAPAPFPETVSENDALRQTSTRGAGGWSLFASFVCGAALTGLAWWRSGQSHETGVFPFYDDKGRIVAWHEFLNGEMVKMSEDRDIDGRRDAWHSYRNGRLTKSAMDNNFDGKEDCWSEWDDASGQTVRVDQNFDGTWDMETRYDMQIPRESRINLDFEGRTDAVIRYDNGIIASMDVIPGGGSTFLFRETYVHGVVKEIIADDNMDGVFDRKEVYDPMGRRLSDAPLPEREAGKP